MRVSADFDASFAALDVMVRRAAERRDNELGSGRTADEFMSDLVAEFYVEAQQHPVGAGSTHMALSLVRLVEQGERIAALEDSLAMRDAALDMLLELYGDG